MTFHSKDQIIVYLIFLKNKLKIRKPYFKIVVPKVLTNGCENESLTFIWDFDHYYTEIGMFWFLHQVPPYVQMNVSQNSHTLEYRGYLYEVWKEIEYRINFG